MRQALLLIFASPNGRDGWALVKPADVPAWVKEPKNIGRLMAGEMCMKCDDGETGSAWYRAEKVPSAADISCMKAARAKRERRAARNRALH